MVDNLDFEKREKLHAILDRVLKEQLHDNGYVVIIAYEAIEVAGQGNSDAQIGVMSHILTNLNAQSKLILWKNILPELRKRIRALVDYYELPE